MLLIHPAIQFMATCLALYALYLGYARLSSQLLKRRLKFNWKLHVKVGLLAQLLWLAGFLLAVAVSLKYWGSLFVTGQHGRVGFVIVCLGLAAISTGLYMDHRKARRRILPLLHAVLNLGCVLLALWQLWSGWQVLQFFVWQ